MYVFHFLAHWSETKSDTGGRRNKPWIKPGPIFISPSALESNIDPVLDDSCFWLSTFVMTETNKNSVPCISSIGLLCLKTRWYRIQYVILLLFLKKHSSYSHAWKWWFICRVSCWNVQLLMYFRYAYDITGNMRTAYQPFAYCVQSKNI